jgi:UDP-glucose 4-epimerase
MNVLILGGAGYIGSHVVRELLDNKYSVTVFDNLSSSTSKNLFEEASFIKGDILNYDHLNSVMKNGFDAVFHFAAFKAAGESMINPQKYSLNNINGTLNIINAATVNKIRFFIFSSSAAVYGEPDYLPIDENHPTNPTNFYGFTKLEIERFLSWYDKLSDFKYATLRYFNAAGYDLAGRILGLEKNPQNLIPSVMEVASGKREKILIFGNDYPTPDGTGIRDYIHVSDLAKAHFKALQFIADNNASITLNLGSETGISVKSIVDAAIRITGRKIPSEIVSRRDGDCACLYASSAKAKVLLDWNAQHSDTDTLIRSTWNRYKS